MSEFNQALKSNIGGIITQMLNLKKLELLNFGKAKLGKSLLRIYYSILNSNPAELSLKN